MRYRRGDKLDTRRIKVELLQLYKDELTTKEYESLEMAATGSSKREIAARARMTIAGVSSLQMRAMNQIAQIVLTRVAS
jgi:DNA-binding CsgD family transcriptional regulator